MFDEKKIYKIQYSINDNEKEFTFTGKILQEGTDFIQIKTLRGESIFLHRNRIIKLEEYDGY